MRKATLAVGRPDHTWYEVENVPIDRDGDNLTEAYLMGCLQKMGNLPFETLFVKMLYINGE